jgi:chromosome segregation ATPase
LHERIEQLTAEKHDIESSAAEQAETCRQLTEANNSLSARTLTLAEEAASAPERIRKQLEAQISEREKALEKAEAEIEEMKTSAQTQRAALFDEMNTMHEENANLRAQLRGAKK